MKLQYEECSSHTRKRFDIRRLTNHLKRSAQFGKIAEVQHGFFQEHGKGNVVTSLASCHNYLRCGNLCFI